MVDEVVFVFAFAVFIVFGFMLLCIFVVGGAGGGAITQGSGIGGFMLGLGGLGSAFGGAWSCMLVCRYWLRLVMFCAVCGACGGGAGGACAGLRGLKKSRMLCAVGSVIRTAAILIFP